MALLIDVLHGDRGSGVEDDRLQLLENGQGGIEQTFASGLTGFFLPGGESLGERPAATGAESQVAVDGRSDVVGRKRVLLGEKLVCTHHQGDAPGAAGAGMLGRG